MKNIEKAAPLKTILTQCKYDVDFYQREYRWGETQIEQMITDLHDSFWCYYKPEENPSIDDVQNYGYYFMGSIITTQLENSVVKNLIDGQQRITSILLLLMYLRKLQGNNHSPNIESLIFEEFFSKKRFTINVEERNACMNAIFNGDENYAPENESSNNLLLRYKDIEELFPDDLKGETLPFFINWLIFKVLLLEIVAPTDDDAHTIFLTMNDRGLSLNSAEMMKAFIIQNVSESSRETVNKTWKQCIAEIKNAFALSGDGTAKNPDVDFISTWLRAKYADSIRETKKGASDRDFELLGDKFHTWVRQNASNAMGLNNKAKYESFVTKEMTCMQRLYLSVKTYSEKLTPDYEAVFYNANRDVSYQSYFILAAVKPEDSADIANKKIRLISTFIDIFVSVRIFNSKKINWNTNKITLFKLMKRIRNKNLSEIGKILFDYLIRMSEKIDAVSSFELNQFSSRYMLHMLARLTNYIDMRMGYSSKFEQYICRDVRSSYDIEHILPDRYDDYKDEFSSEEEFAATRKKFGNLLLLTRDHNRSYQDKQYDQKVVCYRSDNILAQSLNEQTYQNNPQFVNLKEEFAFKPYQHFDKNAVLGRNQLYLNIAKAVWNPEQLREISGGWDTIQNVSIRLGENNRCFIVEYGNGRSWEDATELGFLSADGSTISNISVGDLIECHIQGVGYVGVGICTEAAAKANEFFIENNGCGTKIMDCEWQNVDCKNAINTDNEYFIGIDWKQTCEREDGYWENGMQALPIIAYEPTSPSVKETFEKVLRFFNISLV